MRKKFFSTISNSIKKPYMEIHADKMRVDRFKIRNNADEYFNNLVNRIDSWINYCIREKEYI